MLDFSKIAFIFPGQGSQAVGMGKAITDAYPIAKETIEQANDIMGINLSEMMFEGSEDTLGDTAITQPAMYVVGMAVYRALIQELPDAIPAFVAGHSLGEFTALTVAGALSYEDGLKLVQKRGELMKLAGEQHPGGMAAILALDVEAVQGIVTQASEQSGGVVVIANDNCPGQIVISGDSNALGVAVELAKEAGARRAIPLDVSVATHSPLMQPAKDGLLEALNLAGINDATIPVVQNVCACPVTDATTIRTNLEKQLVSSVRWTESMQLMIDSGIETFIELGSKNVLTGLLRRIDRSKTGITIQDTTSLSDFITSNT
ncbi:MAG: ACP S-malonyltransferase [Chloroflexota bacterium]